MSPLLILMGLQAVMGAAGSYQQGREAEAQHEYEAELARQQARREAAARSEAEAAERKDSRRRLAAIENDFAGRGVLLAGTPATMLEAQATTDEYNIQARNRYAQQRRLDLLTRADNSLIMGKAAKRAGTLGAITTLAGGAVDMVMRMPAPSPKPSNPLKPANHAPGGNYLG